MPSSDRDTEELQRRVTSLEASVRALTDEVQRLRAANVAASPVSAPHLAPRSDAGQATRRKDDASIPWLPAQLDFESLIGRYGTLVLSTVSSLTAVGLAVAGLRLRRTERSFGASVLGLSLAVTLVCGWGAGPALRLVPDWAAFLLAALTSVTLAVFAHAERDEPLWSVGFSGAAIAPFITANGRSDLVMLAAYGVAVLASAGYAMNARRWLVAARLFLLVALLYTAALATGFEKDGGPLLAMGFPLMVAALGRCITVGQS